jgi:2-polyprenyl-6-methoxyphenol hydroxylase-like FAD-dependent oxidoreductase
MATERTPVLIVGAGPVGLALAIELGTRAIPCKIIERNDRVGHAPRAKTTHVRTRELLRRWGLAEDLAKASPLGIDYPSDVAFVTRLAGHALARIENAFNCDPAPDPRYSEHAQWIPQYVLEEVLQRRAADLPGVDIRFNCEFLAGRHDQAGVRSEARDLLTGETLVIDSDYLIGADGARSPMREVIGAKMEGRYGLSRNYNVVFRAPGLAEAHGHGRAIMYWQVNADAPSLVGPMDTGDRWFFMPTGVSKDFQLSPEGAAAMIRKATGLDLPYEILSTDEWVASEFIADTYRDRRIFLAGDACHLHPPFGGYGMNMGIADAVDLGWKLAAAIQGWGGEALLESYEAERRPIHRRVIDEAVANHAVLGHQLWQQDLEDDGEAGERARAQAGAMIQAAKRREFKNLGVVLGYCYTNSPVIDGEPGTPVMGDPGDYQPSAAPGCIAPHLWLREAVSLYDEFGSGFTLLATRDGMDGALQAAAGDAARLGVPLTLVAPDDPRLFPLYGAALALVRPDQHIAWRGDVWPGAVALARAAGLEMADV